MKFALLLPAMVCLFIISCQTEKTPDYPEQLKKIFVTRIEKLDSAAAVDSFQMIRMQPLTAELGAKINDSIYKISYYKVVRQMSAAKDSGRTDSLAFYQEELDYMKGQVDSMSKAITTADTADLKFGKMAAGAYLLRKNGKTHSDTAYFFFDKNMKLMNAEILDSMVRRSLQFVR